MNAAPELGLLHWNLHGLPFTRGWSLRTALLAERLAALQPTPDFLLFCEVWLPGYAAELADALRPHFRIVRPLEGWRPAGGLVTFHHCASPWKVERATFHPFQSAAPWWRIWEGDGFGGKGIRHLALHTPGGRAAVLHTHVQAQYGKRTYAGVRARQATQLTRLAAELAAAGAMVLAVGDLNTLPGERVFRRLSGYWHDLTTTLRDGLPDPTTTGSPGEWIDYGLAFIGSQPPPPLLASQRLSPRQGRVEISDHYGLYLRVRLSGLAP